MNRKRKIFAILGIILLLALGLTLGGVSGALLRATYNRAAATSSPSNTPLLASGDFFSQEFASSTEIVPVSGLAVGGLSDALLKSSVWNALMEYEQTQNCRAVTNTAINLAQINQAGAFWIEDWTVDACGKTQVFKVRFRPDQVGGTIYEISHP